MHSDYHFESSDVGCCEDETVYERSLCWACAVVTTSRVVTGTVVIPGHWEWLALSLKWASNWSHRDYIHLLIVKIIVCYKWVVDVGSTVQCVWQSVLLCTVKNQKDLNPVVDQVLKQQMQPLFGTNSAASLNAEFLARNSASLPHIVAGSNLLVSCVDSVRSILFCFSVSVSAIVCSEA